MTKATAPIRILIVDDHPAVRAGIEGLLAAERDLRPVASTATARDAAQEAARLAPDVAVVDYHLADRDGLALTRRLKAAQRPPAVIVYSAYADGPLTIAAMIAGADGVVSKGGLGDELCAAIRTVARGGSEFPRVAPAMVGALAGRLEPEDVPLFGMLVHGTAPEEVVSVMGMSEAWLEARRWAMLEHLKLGSDQAAGTRSLRARVPAA